MKKTWLVVAGLVVAVVVAAAGLFLVRGGSQGPASSVGPADEAWAAGQLRRLGEVQTLFVLGDMDKDGEHDFATSFAELAERKLVDPATTTGAKGWVFTIGVEPGTPARRWMAIASPAAPKPGVRWLVTNQDGGVHASPDAVTLAADCAIPAGAVPLDPPPDERGAISALKLLVSAQAFFREGDSDKDGLRDYSASLAELGAAGQIDADLAQGRKSGYSFEVRVDPAAARWVGLASPETDPGPTGARWLLIDPDGDVYCSADGPFEVGPDCAVPAGALPWSP